MIDISYAHDWQLSDYGARVSCKKCEAFYDVELAEEYGVPNMGLCKPTIIRDGDQALKGEDGKED